MKDLTTLLTVAAMLILVAGLWYLQYTACREKFPETPLWVCIVKP